MTDTSRPNYHAYLLRLWRADENGIWRATLQESQTGQYLRFDSVETMYEFLQKELGQTLRTEPAVSRLATDETSLNTETSLQAQ